VTGLKIGYARVSTQGQDRTALRNALAALGVAHERIYVDHGLTGTKASSLNCVGSVGPWDQIACSAILESRHQRSEAGRSRAARQGRATRARAGKKSPAELAELFNIGRSTVYRAIERAGGRAAPDPGGEVPSQMEFAPGDTDPSTGPTSARAGACWRSRRSIGRSPV
jgi:hypothetical protein